jgi:hypothetical protein
MNKNNNYKCHICAAPADAKHDGRYYCEMCLQDSGLVFIDAETGEIIDTRRSD